MVGLVWVVNEISRSLIIFVNHLVQHFVLFVGAEDVLFVPPPNVIRLLPQVFVSTGSRSDPSAPIQAEEAAKNRLIAPKLSLTVSVVYDRPFAHHLFSDRFGISGQQCLDTGSADARQTVCYVCEK